MSMTDSDTHIYPQAGDSYYFGFSLAADDNHIIIGDIGANRVVVYRRDSPRNWVRTRVINPPEDSPFANIGSGFGRSLALDSDTLVIGASEQRVNLKNNFDDYEQRLFPFKPPGIRNVRLAGAVYQTMVGENSSLQRMDIPIEGELAGNSVAAEQGNVAFVVSNYGVNERSSSYTVLISNGQRTHFLEGSVDVAIRKQRLAVIDNHLDKVLLFDLHSPNIPLQEITVPFPVRLITLSDNFIVVSNGLSPEAFYPPRIKPQSFVFRLDDGANHTIEGYGKIALNHNLLVRSSCDSPFYRGKLDMFDLNQIMTSSRLISSEDESIRQAKLTDNLLVTTRRRLMDSHSTIHVDWLTE